MDVELKRNVVLVGHAHCGKTSLAESMLFVSKAISRKGEVVQGNTVSDFNEDERQRKISINTGFMNATYNSHQIQIIDTPGYMDFIGEAISAIKVADAAVVVINAMNGVEVGTEDIWQRLQLMEMPRIIFINKTEKPDVNIEAVLSSIQEQLSARALVIGMNSSELIEAVAESDDALLEKYLEVGSLSPNEVSTALKAAVLSGKIYPVLMGSALMDKGVKELLEVIISDLPSPVERAVFKCRDAVSGEEKDITPSEDGLFAAFVFKLIFDSHLGQLSLARIFRGTLKANTDFYNVTAKTKEHVGTINILQGKEQVPVQQAGCGDIIAMTKLKNTHVSDSICSEKEKILFDPILFPEPSISASVKPKTRADEEKISASLHHLCEEDHTFMVSRNNETRELIVSGIGDLHLKIILERMKKRYNVDVELGKPKVSYRETITRKASARHKYKKQSGGRGQYGDVELEIEPLPINEEKYEFVNKIFGGAIPKNYIPSIEKGVIQAIKEGVIAGYHTDHIKITVVDGSYHAVDSSDMAFQIAGGMALKEAIKSAGPILIEPIMEVAITVPDEFIGQISGDVSSRRGRIMGAEARGKKEIMKVNMPLSEMSQYATDLRSMTGGRGNYSMKMSHYEPAPAKITEQVVAERKAKE